MKINAKEQEILTVLAYRQDMVFRKMPSLGPVAAALLLSLCSRNLTLTMTNVLSRQQGPRGYSVLWILIMHILLTASA